MSPLIGPASSSVPSPRIEATAHWCFRRLSALNSFRKNHPKTFHAIVWPFAFVSAFLIWLKTGDWMLGILGLDPNAPAAEIAVLAIHELLVTFLTVIFVNSVIALVPFAHRSMAMKALGIIMASVTRGEFSGLLESYVSDQPRTESIRVICISGAGLFGNETSGRDLPLRDWAQTGRLEVIMPVSSPDNPTVKQRWAQYSASTKRDSYPTVGTLVDEINEGKKFLRAHGNRVIEHHILCMWRVVLLHNYCFVQNYFPNLDGSLSNHAPTFVYVDEGNFSYYQTFSEMFRLVSIAEEDRRYQNSGIVG